ncbi:tetratricopeptide repeat protein [Methylobacterium sp. WSM2598]|uniref:tetratricopeptide repeat protein n=1 Tax=Methylobacterium sp. WSM2598 TaxID=398261 RepID=UPI0003A7373D|nr:tetratricopeptide repeat protein [Methylobacterium sp. WSM2598]
MPASSLWRRARALLGPRGAGEEAFDPDFYARRYLDARALSPEERARHFAVTGRREGRAPNAEVFLHRLAAHYGPPEPDFDLAFYRRQPDLAEVFARDWEFLAHYLERGRGEGRPRNVADHLARLERAHGPLGPHFEIDAYRRNEDLALLFDDEWQFVAHFLQWGRAEGRFFRHAQFALCDAAREARVAGRFEEAIGHARALVAELPRNREAASLLVHLLTVTGREREAQAALAEAGLAPAEGAALRALGAYLRRVSREQALALVDGLPGRFTYLEPGGVAERILAAKAARRPFALLRLGDGEGCLLRVDAADEAAFAPLYAANRETFARIWFGDGFDAAGSGFSTLAAGLSEAAAEADILGVPYRAWIEHEYRIVTPSGVPGVTNVLRWLDARAAAGLPVPPLCQQTIHVALGQGDFFRDLLAGEAEVGLIACFPDLPEAIRRRFGVGAVEFHKIPGEQMSRRLIGEQAAGGAHYPDVFEAVTARLSRPLDGRIFLVAGGLLGKFYALTIRRHGGIAIDIGSLADVWMQKVTRPGYEHLAGLALTET